MDPSENQLSKPRPTTGFAFAALLHQRDELRDRIDELEAKRARALVRADELRDLAREQEIVARNAAERARYIRAKHLADLQATLNDWLADELPPRSQARHTSTINEQDHA